MSDAQGRTTDSEARVTGLAAHVVHETSAPRLARQWSRVAARRGTRHARWQWLTFAAALGVAFLVGFVIRGRVGAPSATFAPSWEGATLESAGGGETLTLPGGAEVRLGPATRVRVGTWTDARAALSLEHGDVTLDVPHVAGRSWEVAAGAFDVHVVGTKFVVRRELSPEGDKIGVEVIRGKVQVKNRNAPEDVHDLVAGESWRADAATAANTATPTNTAPSALASAAAEAPSSPQASASSSAAAGEPATSPSGAPAPGSSAVAAAGPALWEEQAKARKYREAYETLGADGFSRELAGASAFKLEELALVAMSSGHPRDAERAYDDLRKRFRGDSRAGLAAFQVGRLRQDALGNPSGAAEALSDAIALAPGGPFRQDAEARRVRALEAMGATAKCIQARDAYLARYPSGAHAAVVRTRCGGK